MQSANFLNYLFASIISLSGLAVGIVLVKIAPEEWDMLKGKFSLAGKIILMLIFAILFIYFRKNPRYLFLIFFLLVLAIAIEYTTRGIYGKLAISYLVFVIIFLVSSRDINLFATESSLIFLYGLPTGSLLNKSKKEM